MKKLIENQRLLHNPIIEYELLSFLLKNKTNSYTDAALKYVNACSQRMSISAKIVRESVKAKHKYKLGLADSIIYGTAQVFEAKLITADNDFRGLKGVEVL